MKTKTNVLVSALSMLVCVGAITVRADTTLLLATKSRDMNTARALLQKHVDVNTPAADGSTALHWGVHWNDAEIAGALIRAGANVNARTDLGITPLHLACKNGSSSLVEALLTAGARIDDVRDTGETVLMTCARSGNAQAVKLLLDRGADPNAKEKVRGQTALMWAAAENNTDALELLLGRGADINTKTTGGWTPLIFATRYGSAESTRALLAHGANVNVTASDGLSPLLAATFAGHWQLAEFLLDQRADPNAIGAGYTALHWASGGWEGEFNGALGTSKYQEWGARGPGKLPLVKALLAHGADPNIPMKKAPPRFGATSGGAATPVLIGSTAIDLAAYAGDTAVMRALLAAGANPRILTTNQNTVLIIAAGLGRTLGESRVGEANALETVKLALELGDDINAENINGESALHAAAYNGFDSVVQYLVDKGAKVNARNVVGATPSALAEGYVASTMCTVIWPNTAALLKRLGGVDTLEFTATVDAVRSCPATQIDVAIRDPANQNSMGGKLLFIKVDPSTAYVGGSCQDLKAGRTIQISGIRALSEGKVWDGSITASRIEIRP